MGIISRTAKEVINKNREFQKHRVRMKATQKVEDDAMKKLFPKSKYKGGKKWGNK